MPPWALRVVAVVITALSLLGSTNYALAHPKNPNAPLQPPVAEKPAPPTTAPPTTAPPTARATATGAAARTTATGPTPSPTRSPTLRPATPTPVPQITLRAGVRATAVPSITITHVS